MASAPVRTGEEQPEARRDRRQRGSHAARAAIVDQGMTGSGESFTASDSAPAVINQIIQDNLGS